MLNGFWAVCCKQLHLSFPTPEAEVGSSAVQLQVTILDAFFISCEKIL